ncbi:MAG: imidazoleglycerol-phosphate dehydratase HisB [Actinomycetota bacterium]|nr:imidazoleglycerol-phosphate dehydratase HisB [Actinomycetota bacterium]
MADARRAVVERATSETSILAEIDLEGTSVAAETGVPFFDHMLMQLGRHGPIGLRITAKGDLDVDAHHTVEDTGLCLGEALDRALGDRTGIRRYGDALVPMEEALAQVALDISGRPRLVYAVELPTDSIGQFETHLVEEFLQALCRAAGLTLHVSLLAGRDPHHSIEAIFKAVARALGEAIAVDPRSKGAVPSTKGVL